MGSKGRYQIRKAAGQYWLLDMNQSGVKRLEYVLLNESGAYIWELYDRLQSETDVAEELHKEFGISVEEALADVRQFLKQLVEQGIVLESGQ